MEKISRLKIYSLGIVATNKALSSKICEIVPLEDLPMLDGEITSGVSSYKAAGVAQNQAAYHLDVQTTMSIKATWLPLGSSNRMTAPDVRRGETVVLYRFSDSDQFWWTTLKDDMALRRLETVIYAYSASQVEGSGSTADNMYFLEISTHQKLVHFHTSKENGEPFAYDIQINTGAGFIQIQDDAGNYFTFDSKNRLLELANSDGSVVTMDRTAISLTAVDSISLNAKNVNIEATENVSLKASTVSVSGNSAVILNSPATSIN